MIGRRREFGIFLIRVGLGVMFMLHGYPKLLAGPPAWERLGSTMTLVGIDFFPIAWGLLAGLAETLGGAMLILGLFTHFSCFALTFTMTIATAFHLNKGDGFAEFSHPMELGTVTLAMILIGAGRYSIDYLLFGNRNEGESKRIAEPAESFILG